MFDENGDGQIDRFEMLTMLDALGMSNLTDEEVDQLVPPLFIMPVSFGEKILHLITAITVFSN